MKIRGSVNRPHSTHKTWLESQAYYRLLEWATSEGIYRSGANDHQEDGFAEAINALIDNWEEPHGEE